MKHEDITGMLAQWDDRRMVFYEGDHTPEELVELRATIMRWREKGLYASPDGKPGYRMEIFTLNSLQVS